jgi:hypothetical protein
VAAGMEFRAIHPVHSSRGEPISPLRAGIGSPGPQLSIRQLGRPVRSCPRKGRFRYFEHRS